ncbi:hypothetical protein [Streptomyces sp. CC208A]|uniref:hypothetical protein n=1 Tax=Streptomyces sp. CC208A TaxID=3044573 RepID=UPI0024A9F14B|nr:hypothetical protein [Streptomyces sp. CC208A]
MRGTEAAGPALDDRQQAQVELVGRPAWEGWAEVEASARLCAAGDEVVVRAGVVAEGEWDQLGGRVSETAVLGCQGVQACRDRARFTACRRLGRAGQAVGGLVPRGALDDTERTMNSMSA